MDNDTEERYFGHGRFTLDGEGLWQFLVHSDHGWDAWLDGYGAGFAQGQAELIDRVFRAEADADRYYRLVFDPPTSAKLCLSYAERCRIRGDERGARAAEERLRRMFVRHPFPDVGAQA